MDEQKQKEKELEKEVGQIEGLLTLLSKVTGETIDEISQKVFKV